MSLKDDPLERAKIFLDRGEDNSYPDGANLTQKKLGIVLEHVETKEFSVIKPNEKGTYPTFNTKEWRVVDTVKNVEYAKFKDIVTAEVAAQAADLGIPVDVWAEGFRWLLGKQCPYCEVSTEIISLQRCGKLSKEQSAVFLKRVLTAKSNNDKRELDVLKGVLRGMISRVQ